MLLLLLLLGWRHHDEHVVGGELELVELNVVLLLLLGLDVVDLLLLLLEELLLLLVHWVRLGLLDIDELVRVVVVELEVGVPEVVRVHVAGGVGCAGLVD